MSYEVGRNYNVKVSRAYIGETAKGEPVIVLDFENDQGDTITHRLYLSEKARERSLATMSELFDVTRQHLANVKWIDNMETFMQGKECSISIDTQEWNGKVSLRVQYVSPKRLDTDLTPPQRVAKMFGGEVAPASRSEDTSSPAPVPTEVATEAVALGEDGLPF
jgi:hypothetical protein